LRQSDFRLAPLATLCGDGGFNMISPETYDHIELIKKRAGQLWRFL